MKKYLPIFLISILFFSGCMSVDQLKESDRMDVLKQIIKEEKIQCLGNNFSIIDPKDSTLYFITNYPGEVQKYNHTNPVIDLDRLFSKNDLFELEKQVNSFDTSLRLSTFIRDEKIHFYSASDSSKRECIEFFLSYPLLNKDKNAIIVFLSYYGGLLCAGEDVLIYVKKSGKWIRLTKIWLSVS